MAMASMRATNESEKNVAVGAHRLAQYGLLAVIAASVVNVCLLFIGLAVAEFPADFVGGPFGPLAVGPVVVNSAVAAVAATVVYGVITRYAARPNRTFAIVAGVALVLSFAMFLAPDIAGAPLALYTFLSVMHVAAAVVIVGVLIRASNQGDVPG